MGVGQFFDFVKNLQYQVFKILEIKEPPVPVFLKNFKISELQVLILSHFQIQKNPFFWVFEHFQRAAGSHQRTGKELAVYQPGVISNPEGSRLGDLKFRGV
jgi:hypothetical protein